MRNKQHQESLLRREVALKFPLGSISEIGREVCRAHFNAAEAVKIDRYIGAADKPYDQGNRKRLYTNEGMRIVAAEYPADIKIKDCCVGKKRTNNHVELIVGRYIVTIHHLSGDRTMPESRYYLRCNAKLNNLMCQAELFPLGLAEEVQQLKCPFNLLILHKEAKGFGEVESIEFVFPQGKKRLVTFSIEELILEQEVLADMDKDDLEELRARHDLATKDLKIG